MGKKPSLGEIADQLEANPPKRSLAEVADGLEAQTPPADPFVQAPSAPSASPSPSGSGPLASPAMPSVTGPSRIPTQQSDPAAFAYNSAALLDEAPPVQTPEQVAVAVNANKLQRMGAVGKKAPYVPVPQRDKTTEVDLIEQQYTPAMKAAKEEAGTWSSGDEYRFQEITVRQQAEALKQLRNQLGLKVQQQGYATPEDEAQFAAMQQQRAVLEDAYKNLVTSPPKDGFDVALEQRQKEANEGFKEAQKLVQRGDYLSEPVIREYAVKPMLNAANEFVIGGLIGGAARGLDFVGNIPAKVTGEEEYYSPFAELADNINRGMEATSAFEGEQGKGGLFDEDWNFNGDAALPQLIRTGVYMAGLMASGGYGGRAGLGAASFLSTEEDYYQEAIDAGLKPGEAQQFSILAAGATASLEGINPQLYGQGTVKGQMAQRALKALKGGSTMKEAIKDGTLFVLKEVGGENVQEFAQAGGDMLARYVTNQKIGDNKLDPSMTPQEAVETILLTTALSGLAASAARAADRPLHQQALEWAGQNPEAMELFIKNNVPQAQQEPLIAEVQRRAKIERGLPEQMQGPQRWEVASAVAEKEKIKEEQAEASVDDTVASIVGNKFEERISEQDERIANAMGVSAEDIAKKEETDRLREQYDKAKLKSEVTGQPMPEGMKRPAEVELKPKINEADAALAEPTGEEAVQISALPDTPTEVEPIPATAEAQGELVPASEPVLAEGSAVTLPEAGIDAPVTIEERQTPARFEIPQQDASTKEALGPTPVQQVRQASLPKVVQEGPTTSGLGQEVSGVRSAPDDNVGAPAGPADSVTSEDQPTPEATPASSASAAPGVPDDVAPPPPAKPVVKKPSEASKRRKRATAERLLKEHPELEEVLTDDAVHYERISNKTSYDTAKALVEAMGYDEAAKAILEGAPMRSAVRNMIGRIVTEHYRKEGDMDKLADLTEEWFATITDAAQGLAAMHTLYGDLYDAETLFYKVQRDVSLRRKAQEETAAPEVRRVAKGLRKINEEGVEEVIRTRRIRQKVADAGEANPTERTTDPPSYGAKNKVVTKSRYQEALKRMRGQMNSGISPEMVIVAAYHIEAGSRSFAAVAERVAKRLGKKALPYLKGAYKEAYSQLKRDGVDVGEPTSDEEINDYIAKELSPQALKDGLKALDLKIDDIIRKHWTEQEDIRRTLADKFIQDAGLGKEEAEALAKAVQSEFDKVTAEKKRKLIQSLFSVKERVVKARKVKGIEDDIVLMTNLGAFSDKDLTKRYGDAMGFARMTEEDISAIQGLADNIQKAKGGRPKLQAIQDLVAYQADMRGMSFGEVAQSVWYANMLSGPNTHLVNFFANLAQVMSEFGVAVTQAMGRKDRRKALRLLAEGLLEGGKNGWLEAGAAWRTGRAHLKDKIEAPAALERMDFKGGNLNPANYLKYVRRAMVAADVLGYETAKGMRAYQLAVKMANFDTDNPSMDLRQKALDILNKTDDSVANAKEQAQKEYEADVNLAKSEREKRAITEAEYNKALKTAERDRKRRVFELVEAGRQEDVQKASSDFGSRTTYNYKPEGLLGALTNGLNATIEQVPGLAYVIPFRNIIANVANEAINYTPWGFARAASARGSVTGSLASQKYKEALSPKMTPEQLQQHKLDLITKASWGIVLATVTFLLSDPGDDDDPTIEITANGYADWKKNMALKETGWQPYSFKYKGKWYSYQYTPLVLVFGFVGDYRDAQKYRGEKITDNDYSQFASAMGRSMAAFLNMTWLTTADKVLKAVANPSGERTVDDLMKEAQRIGKTFVVPAFFTQASREVQSLTETPQKDTKGSLAGEILKDIPVLRDQYPNQINALGEPIIPKTDRFISSVDPDPVWNLFADKAYAISTPDPNGLTVTPDGEKERVMTPKERHDFLVLRGKRIREKVEKRFKALAALEKGEKENAKDPNRFGDEMRSIVSAATKYAKAKIGFGEKDPDYLKGVREVVED